EGHSPARHRPGARSARREGRRHHHTADRLFQGATVMTFLSLGNWLKPLQRQSRVCRRRPRRHDRTLPARFVPRLETLEDRCLLSGGISLTPSEAAPQLVGERITWTATATDCGDAPVYQFSAAPHGGAFRVVRDFSPTNSFTWTPMQEGTYDIEVTVK